MPIRPENRHRYPPDWPQIRKAILDRAGHRCEKCGLQNHTIGYRDNGKFYRLPDVLREASYQPGHMVHCADGRWFKVIKIVLTIAHLDHQPENCDPSNLRALCQRCHLSYDAQHHQQTAYATRRHERAIRDLFDGVAAHA